MRWRSPLRRRVEELEARLDELTLGANFESASYSINMDPHGLLTPEGIEYPKLDGALWEDDAVSVWSPAGYL